MTKKENKYEVWVNDNYHFMDEDERYLEGTYNSYRHAVEVCKEIVDEFLADTAIKCKTPDELYDSYTSFGEDPYILCKDGAKSSEFSAWDYARLRTYELIPLKTISPENLQMITYTQRLDKAIKTAAWAHNQKPQYRKGSNSPYVIHPFGVMLIASSVTNDEDILIACLLHDVLEDVDPKYYDKFKILEDFNAKVVRIVLDVTKNSEIKDWHEKSKAYIKHMENAACLEAVTVCAADKIHNIMSMITDYKDIGEELWSRFNTKSAEDQIWWYTSVLRVICKRKVNSSLSDRLNELILEIKELRKN